MRFRTWLPVMQAIAMCALAWMWWAHSAPTTPGKSDILQWAEGINLPAVAVVAPLEFSIRQSEAAPNANIRFFGYWIVGLLCWWMVGRFFDELLHWQKTKTLDPAPRADLTFALIAFPSTILMAVAFGFAGTESRVISAWASVWLAITSADMIFRLAQLIRHRRRPKFS
jgi:hypothetical protein